MYVYPERTMMTDRVDSAGCICFRDDKVLIIRYFSHYSFPKGHIEEGETAEDAAMRETEEESGIRARIAAPAVTVPSQKKGDERVVYFFPSVYVSGRPEGQDGETDEAFFLDIHAARELLSFEADRKALDEAMSSLGLC